MISISYPYVSVPIPQAQQAMLSLAFAQRFLEFLPLSPRVPWREGVVVYEALGLPCFN